MTFTPIWANAGTPVLWGGCFMLLVGNYFLGHFEASLLARFLRLPWVAPGRIIAANYVSMAVGFGFTRVMHPVDEWVSQRAFDRAAPYLLAMIWATFVVTLLVEWAFVRATLGSSWRDAWRATIRVHLVSYPAVFLLGVVVSPMSALYRLRPVPVADLRPPPGWVYYIALSGREVRRIRLDASREEPVVPIPPRVGAYPGSRWQRLTAEWKEGATVADLVFRDNPQFVILARNFAAVTVSPKPRGARRDSEGHWVYNNMFSGIAEFTPSERPVYAGYWAFEGIRVDGEGYALETPVIACPWSFPTVLPDGKIVAQFGTTLCLLDADSRRVATLGTGCGPLVVLDAPPR